MRHDAARKWSAALMRAVLAPCLARREANMRAQRALLESLKQQVPPRYLLALSGGLCALATLWWLAGITGLLPPSGPRNTQPTSAACQIVAAEYRAVDEVARLVRDVAQPAQCSVRVYSKSGSCRQIDAAEWAAAASVRVSCTTLRNTGREQHTFAHHVVQHWDALPTRLHLVPLPLTGAHHDRLSPLKRGLLDPKHTCQTFADAKRGRAATFAERVSHFCGRASCPEERAVSRDAPCTCHLLNYSLDRYRKRNNVTVVAARPRTLWRWAEAHLKVSQGALRGLPVCTSGVASTSRAWLRSRPRAIFEAIERETAAAHHGEAGHYMERLMAAAYGPLPASPVPLPQSSTSIGKRPLLRSV